MDTDSAWREEMCRERIELGGQNHAAFSFVHVIS